MNIINNVRNSRNSSLPQALFTALRISNLSMDNRSSTRGVPIRDVRGSDRNNSIEFPLVKPGHGHTVLYYLPNATLQERDLPPKPLRGQDRWDYDHVRLPCSKQSEYPVEHPQPGQPTVMNRWQMIQAALRRPILDSKQLADAILSYNHTNRKTWKFTTLHTLFDNLDDDERSSFFHVTLPKIANLALQLPTLIESPIPLLKQGENHSISLSQQQISCLLANAFFCTFPRRNSRSQKEYGSYPQINFTSLYEMEVTSNDVLEKLKCLISYFVKVTQQTPKGVVTFTRRRVSPRSCPHWERSDAPIAGVPLHVDSEGMIEKAHGLIQLDFANKYLGGGVLGHGSVQEEIRFVTCPELMASMLFTEMLDPTEALVMIGAERYSQYYGYGHDTFEWAGPYRDDTPMDASSRKKVAVLAIDALPFKHSAAQYKKLNIVRELNKAWVGFSAYSDLQNGDCVNYPGVATGNWGCGAFRGSPPLKSLIQLMACAEARRPMAYFTFKDYDFADQLIDIYEVLCRHRVTVGQLFNHILRFAESKESDLFGYLRQALRDEGGPPPAPAREASTSRDPAEQATSRPKESVARSESPDLFSQDEEQSQETNKLDHQQNQTNLNEANIENRHGDYLRNSCDSKVTNCNEDNEITDSDAQILEMFLDTSDTDLKMSDNGATLTEEGTKMSDGHTTLPDTSANVSDVCTKLADGSTKMSDIDIKNFVNHTKMPNKFNGDVNTSKNEFKITIEEPADNIKTTKVSKNQETRNAASNRLSHHTSLLFEKMQKFDDENGRLNISVTNTSSADKRKRTIAALNESDVSMESEEKVVTPEPKRKILNSKITDYFKSNPI